ncbi:tRNA lysidine(34) synthetase TilS [Steroidobacter agaridevorans]|uniref:tRNA lysidine(34) synthetase TilS n=1 Tax=Steroidobacter agaridevorans TaxID=2695856 RepID=UPI001321D215|nr:tRNA lysidine(34) synthetase TilS [Steroidobacter agaridevorans]GFE87873.1 tRNA(Ile)-lysidine synthase [Steroidobacter agaridevorans]
MFTPRELQDRVQGRAGGRAWLPPDAAVCVAFSGGLDSTVLLHSFARLAAEPNSYRVRAVHIDHGLHADSALWRDHCARQAQALQVEFTSMRVAVTGIDEVGLEAAARDARYAAFARELRPGEYLLVGHHADDQLETMLLALMRGAGVLGLGAMQVFEPFARGALLRPLWDFTRAELEMWARAEGLHWLTDPSNTNLALDRNFVRHRIVSALRERWPAAAQTALRSSQHLQEAWRALEQLAAIDAERAIDGECLSVEALRALNPERRRNLLRYWIRRRGARAPSTRKLAGIEHDMLAASMDRVPCVGWDGWEMRRHRGWLYCEQKLPALDTGQAIAWPAHAPLQLPAGLGSLRISPGEPGRLSAAKLPATLTVRFREGGETIQPVGHAIHHKLKKLLQASAVLPWWRERLPLVYAGKQLVAVGDLWIADEFAATDGEPAVSIVWEHRPAIVGRYPNV